ncbi:hypothetical protein NHX12_027205 [Muraenolepis orangiensis]|uniref:HAT C-terminal dimerisation domain-containing protein n=1 Tax=Muraenolepis orangiensis TaxID=630683 RepID=A0A9Q0IP08_9TELE|nr:hypothetical protein NHX12_027205 [Muraenolepis orangiensis]
MLSRKSDFLKHLSLCKKKHPAMTPPSQLQEFLPESGQVDNLSYQDFQAESSTNTDGTKPGFELLDTEFFGIISQTPKGKVQAGQAGQLCTKNQLVVSGSRAATSLFRTELKRLHSDGPYSFERHKTEGTSGGKKTKTTFKHTVTQGKLDSLITSYVVKGMHPLSTVEQTEFVELIHGLAPNATVISRRKLQRKLDADFNAKKSVLKEKLKTVQRVCTTADIWSTSKASFMGVTAHWIKPNSTERESVALACRHFPSPHTYSRTAEILEEIHLEFGLSNEKIVATVTDNGSDFAKAFKEFNVSIVAEEDDDKTEEGGLSFVTIDSSEEGSSKGGVILPPHVRCATRTLSLVCTTDARQAMEDSPTLTRLNNWTMAKCSALWNASKKAKAAELLLEVTKEQLKTPCPTRWNSLYDSLNQLSHLRDKLPEMMATLQLFAFNKAELDYLGEYCQILRPIAMAIDRLQGQSSCYYGELIPTLFAVQSKLHDLYTANLRYTSPLLHAILGGFEKRFCSYLELKVDVNEAILATATHPFFKMRWLPPRLSAERRRIHQLILRSAEELGLGAENEKASPNHNDDEEDFFVFSAEETEVGERPGIPSHSKIELETLHFLEDTRKDLRSLELYPLIKLLFARFNTTLTSSAPVERLFAFAGILPLHRRLTPDLFEKLLVLKGN